MRRLWVAGTAIALSALAGISERRIERRVNPALNEGLRLARGEIVVCTDDDCEADPGWAAAMARTLAEQPTAAIVLSPAAARLACLFIRDSNSKSSPDY